jgi:hypothetical protein
MNMDLDPKIGTQKREECIYPGLYDPDFSATYVPSFSAPIAENEGKRSRKIKER